jgi:DNA-directed RNA polymerase alpha subunit
MTIETDGTITPQDALDQSVRILLDQFNAVIGNAPKAAAEGEVEVSSEDAE